MSRAPADHPVAPTDAGALFPALRRPGPLSGARRLAVVLFIALCLAGGSYLRFHNIGKFGFWTDEFFHVFAAQSLLRDGSLAVPLHGEYTRAYPITRITAWSFRHFGVSEASARAPFAAINVLFLLVAFFFVRRLFGVFPAAATLGVLSFAPFMLHMSRECRMYTLFQLLYFTAMAAFALGFEPERRRPGWEGKLDVDVRWLTLAILVMPLAIVIHDLGWNAGVVIAAYVGFMFLWEGAQTGWRSAATSKYGLSVAVIGAVTLALLVFRGGELRDLVEGARDVPSWAPIGRSATNFYRYLLSDTYPVLFFLYPLAAFAFIRSYGRRGFFVVLSFSLLFFLHSYVYGRKGDRYIFYLFPFFVMVSATFVARLVATLFARLAKDLANVPLRIKAAGWICAVPAVYLVFYPWLTTAIRSTNAFAEIDWKAAAAEVRQQTAGEEVIATSPMPYLYYLGSIPEHYMLGEVWDERRLAGHLVENVTDLRAVLDKPGLSVIVTDRGRLGNAAYLRQDMEDLLDARTRLEVSRVDPRILYYQELPAPIAALPSKR